MRFSQLNIKTESGSEYIVDGDIDLNLFGDAQVVIYRIYVDNIEGTFSISDFKEEERMIKEAITKTIFEKDTL